MREQFVREERIIGSDKMDILEKSCVAVFGIGGVGGYVVEGLARAGVGELWLVDHDTVDLTNLNRQIIALHSTIGMDKVDVSAARVKDINPDCKVTAVKSFFLPETADQFDFSRFDYVVDAIDTVTGKIALIEEAAKAGVPVISSMGTGNKLDPTKFAVADLYETKQDPLARVMRHECRKRGVEHVKVVYSTEEAIKPAESEEQTTRRSVPGSISFVPSVAGLIIAGEVVKDLTR